MILKVKKRIKKNKNFIQPQQFDRPITVLVLSCEGANKDDADTRQCARGVAETMRRLGHVVKEIIVTKRNWEKATQTQADVVFNFVEDDGWDLYMKVGHHLEKLKQAQVGHDINMLRYVISKKKIKSNLIKHNISTPKSIVLNRKTNVQKLKNLKFPLIIKPANEHAGIGISQESVVSTMSELEKQVSYIFENFHGDVVIEEFIKGREVHVTIMGNGASVNILPLCEIGFKGKFKDNWGIYSYKAKWDKRSWEYDDARVHSPAKIPAFLQKKIHTLAMETHTAFDCRDIVRLDIRIDEHNTPYVVDINMSPSLNYYDEEDATLASVYAMGWSYDQFIETLACMTYERVHGHQGVAGKRLRK